MHVTKSVHCEYEAGVCTNTDVSECPKHAAASEHAAVLK